MKNGFSYDDRYTNPYGSTSQGASSQAAPSQPIRVQRMVTMSRKALAGLIIILLVLSSLIGFGAMTLANQWFGSGSGSQGSTSVTGSNYTLEDATGSSLSVQEINAKVADSVVEITTESVSQGGWIGEYVSEGAGSGVIIQEDGYIMTNHHVIEGARTIKVSVGDKDYDATLIGSDEDNDVAVLKIDAKGLAAATYGNSDQINVGDLTVVIGNPLGTLGGSVSAGVVSATNREVTLENQTMTLIQTDASVNPGNSGGGMFNDKGQLIGLVVAKSSGEDVEGLGFAIPINVAAESASAIMKNKGNVESSKANTGMTYQDLTDGIYVAAISSSEASKAGFQVGDRVVQVDGKKIKSFSALKKIIQSHAPGDKVPFVVERDGKETKLTLTLVSESDSGSSTQSQGEDSQGNGDQDDSNGFWNWGGGGNDFGQGDDFGDGQNGSGGSWSDLFDQFGW